MKRLIGLMLVMLCASVCMAETYGYSGNGLPWYSYKQKTTTGDGDTIILSPYQGKYPLSNIAWTVTPDTVTTHTAKLYGSTDGSTWTELDTTSSTTPVNRIVLNAFYTYLKCTLVTLTGASAKASCMVTPFANLGASLNGAMLVPDGAVATPSYSFATATNTGIYLNGAQGGPITSVAGNDSLLVTVPFVVVRADQYFGWGSSGVSTPDTKLFRDAANTIALRNGAANQRINLYTSAYTDASNYDRGAIYTTPDLNIATEKAGTGSVRSIFIKSNKDLYLSAGSGGSAADRWVLKNNDGSLLAVTDNAYDIGASAANRPRNVYVGGDVNAANVLANVLAQSADASRLNAAGVAIGSGKAFGISSTAASSGTVDTGLSRCNPASVCVGNGTSGDASGSMLMKQLYIPDTTGGIKLYGGASYDTSISRNAAGTVQVGDAGNNANGKLLAANLGNYVASDTKTAQSANLGATQLVASATAGKYLMTCYTIASQVATTSSTLPYCSLQCTDVTSNSAAWNDGATPSTGISNNTLGYGRISVAMCDAKASTAINYATSGYASSGATPMQYKVYVALEKLP